MSRKLNFDMPGNMHSGSTRSNQRWASREPDPVVQMSLRMQNSTYQEFRDLCAHERRTNGDMLHVLLEHYKATVLRKQDRAG